MKKIIFSLLISLSLSTSCTKNEKFTKGHCYLIEEGPWSIVGKVLSISANGKKIKLYSKQVGILELDNDKRLKNISTLVDCREML